MARGGVMYGATKAALERFTQGLAQEVAQYDGISVTAVSPSRVVPTPGTIHHKLVTGADVFLQNYRPGVAARLGVPLEQAHRASDDAEAALRVLYALATDARMPRVYGPFAQEQRRLAQVHADERRRWRN